MTLRRRQGLDAKSEIESVNLRQFSDGKERIRRLSIDTVLRYWENEAEGVSNPYSRRKIDSLRFNYARRGREYLTGEQDQLRLPTFNGKDIYALAGELAIERGSRHVFELCDFGGGTGQAAADIAAEISSRFGVKANATVVDKVDFSRIPVDDPKGTSVQNAFPIVDASIHEASKKLPGREFDFIMSMHTLKHTPDAMTPLREGCKMLSKGGYLLFSAIPKDVSVLLGTKEPKTFMDVVDIRGKFILNSELTDYFNKWNSGSFVFEHHMLEPDATSENISHAGDMISARRVGEETPDFDRLFYRKRLKLITPRLHNIGFVLAKTQAEEEKLLDAGFVSLTPTKDKSKPGISH